MAKEVVPTPDDPAEYQRFLETARKVGADETPGALDRAFEKIAKAKPKDAKTPR